MENELIPLPLELADYAASNPAVEGYRIACTLGYYVDFSSFVDAARRYAKMTSDGRSEQIPAVPRLRVEPGSSTVSYDFS